MEDDILKNAVDVGESEPIKEEREQGGNVVDIGESGPIKGEEHEQSDIKIVEMVQQESEKIIKEYVEQIVQNIVGNKEQSSIAKHIWWKRYIMSIRTHISLRWKLTNSTVFCLIHSFRLIIVRRSSDNIYG